MASGTECALRQKKATHSGMNPTVLRGLPWPEVVLRRRRQVPLLDLLDSLEQLAARGAATTGVRLLYWRAS
jgi:hypothetical protein